MPEFCKLGYSATLARAHVHNFIQYREPGVLGLTGYVPSGPLSLLPGACGEEVPGER